MNENLPMKVENKFFNKIKNFFRKIFGFSSNYNNRGITNNDYNQEDSQFLNSIKVEENNEYLKEKSREMKREELLNKIDDNPEIIKDLSEEKLKKIKELYLESIKSYEEKIAKLKIN